MVSMFIELRKDRSEVSMFYFFFILTAQNITETDANGHSDRANLLSRQYNILLFYRDCIFPLA